jgi:phosphatidylserine/phosphatidylglycerophosphate/cardiolipin synthase-like enzyme
MELLLNNEDNRIQDKLIELIEMNESIRILSPYLTKNKALDCILQKSDFKLKLVLNFDPKSILNHIPSIDINLIKVLIESGHEVFNNRKLHSKLYITDESLILGSSNFTDYGLRTRKESAIHVKRDSNQKIYEECKKYFDGIIKDSKKVTIFQINKIDTLLNNYNYLDHNDNYYDIFDRLEDVFSGKFTKNSCINDYELKNPYPKTLQELQNGLIFDFIDYAKIEDEFRTKFQGSVRNKDEKISFIKANLYEINKGYNILTKINGNLSTIYKWHRVHYSPLFGH